MKNWIKLFVISLTLVLIPHCGIDSDGDGEPDITDKCPLDSNKIEPGECGCGIEDGTCSNDIDTDGDGTPDKDDPCPTDPNKIDPGECGCGILEGTCNNDSDTDGDGTPDKEDPCPTDPNKVDPGECGCGINDKDSDNDNTPDCKDNCPADPNKTELGECGCGVAEGVCSNDTENDKVKVFILAGQSNMQGAGTVTPTAAHLDKNGGKGTLEYLVNDPNNAAVYGHLVTDSGDWVKRDDVWIIYDNRSGPLSVGYGVDAGHIGPEMQFGHVMGDLFEAPVLIIKTAWGGKSLQTDFRPPSSGGEVGPYYTEMVNRVHDVLKNIAQEMPGYNGQGYEIRGFGWHQGWNDRVNQAANDEYQFNCVNLVNDLRDEFGIPDMPFVLATTGMSGWNETHPRALSLMNAQLAVPSDPRLKVAKNVFAVETRDFWRDEADSPANQGYHWNRNAETMFLIGNGMGQAMADLVSGNEVDDDNDNDGKVCSHTGIINAVFFAQNHVQQPDHEYFGLVGNRKTLIKAHIVCSDKPKAPPVKAIVSVDGKTLELSLKGPAVLPASINIEPGVVQHTYDNSFTAFIPKEWVKPGLQVTIKAADEQVEIKNLKVGAPTEVIMTMFDVQYFVDTNGDYPAGWKDELEAKWPVSKLTVRRLPHVVFKELVIPPRAGVAAARVTSKDDYKQQTGLNFDGEQAAALQWKSALKAAAGTGGRVSLYFVNIYGVGAGGQAGGFGGVGNGKSVGILNHELGHALSLPHWGNNAAYPYRGEMFGIPAPDSDVHVGPTWGFDLPSGTFLPPTVQPNAVGGTVGTYKKDPMQGGGQGDQEKGFLMRHFSDYSVFKMRNYLENHVAVWNQNLGKWATWDANAKAYTKVLNNNGVAYPVQRDVEVISIMAAVSGAKPDVCMVYPPIGPYVTGLIDLFDPRNASDRQQAEQVFCPAGGCDVSLKIVQGGKEKVYMLAIPWEPSVDPLSGGSLKTKALNLKASDGDVTRVDLLQTPDAEHNGYPQNPKVLYTWTRP